MTRYAFAPDFSTIATFDGLASIPALEREVGVYSASPEFVRAHCGPIAVGILDRIPESYHAEADRLGLSVNIDVRIHRLYPTDIPAYPGWHCDGEYRETYFSQPDLDRVKVHHHLIATVSSHEGGVSNTEFLDEPFAFESDSISPDHGLWQQVNEGLGAGEPRRTRRARDGELVHFDSWTLHRACPAMVRGWRLFFRASMWHRPHLGDGGMISKQEQVYKYIGHYGW